MKPTRREVLVTIAALAAPSPAQGQPIFLTAAELECLTALAEAIIPRTDTPGAADAGVPATIDRRLAASPQLAERFRSGMKALDADAIGLAATCRKCGGALHACSQCGNFDTSARFECSQSIPERIVSKQAANSCTFFTPAKTFDLTGSRGVGATPDDARAAFDNLFKK